MSKSIGFAMTVLLERWKADRHAIVASVAKETGHAPLVVEVVLSLVFEHLAGPGDVEVLRRAMRELHRAERERARDDVSSGVPSFHLAAVRSLRAALELLPAPVAIEALVTLTQVFERCAVLHAEVSQVAVQNAAERRAQELERALKSLSAAQDMLMHQARLKAMGSLADGVAHDVNNSLNAVLLRTTLLDKQVEGKAKQHLEAIETVVRHAAATVQRLQEFARRRNLRSRAACDASSVAREAVEMTRPHWTNRAQLNGGYIEVRLDAGEGFPAVGIDAAELRAILVDLLLNSTEAIHGDGLIEVAVRGQADRVEIEVSDNGPGIPEEYLRRIFEPFFTTRGPRSSGLGLAMAWGVLDRVGGNIVAENRAGGGATFRIKLPHAVVERAQELAPAAAERVRSVLLVDDDTDSRETLEQILVLKGHEVEMAADGRQALALYHPDRHEAVLCDVSMPNMNGLQLARAIRAKNPEALIALLTGWGAEVADDAQDVVDAVFQKPIDIEAVSRFLSRSSVAAIAGKHAAG